jgi:hypothetical protein
LRERLSSKDSFHVGDHYRIIQGSELPDLSQTTQGSELPDLELGPSALPCIHEMSKQSTFESVCANFANPSTFDAATQLCQTTHVQSQLAVCRPLIPFIAFHF